MTVGSDPHGQAAVVPDPQGTASGRGAHLHPTSECYELAVRRRAFARALRYPGGHPGGGLSSTPLGDYLTSRQSTGHTTGHTTGQTTDRDWSSSS